MGKDKRTFQRPDCVFFPIPCWDSCFIFFLFWINRYLELGAGSLGMIEPFCASNCQVWNLQHFIDNQNFKLVKSLVMFRIMHVNPVGCGLELSSEHGCRHVPREPTAKHLATHGFPPKIWAAESREKTESEAATFIFTHSPVYKLVMFVFINDIKMHSRSSGADDGCAMGSVWAKWAESNKSQFFFSCSQKNICLALCISS